MMNKHTLVGVVVGILTLFFIACSDDDDSQKTTLRLDRTSFALPVGEDFLEATLYITPAPENIEDLYLLKLDASKISGPIAFPGIAGIEATQNAGEYKLSIDRAACVGTFNLNLVDRQTDKNVACVSFDVEELANEYSVYSGYTIDITDKDKWVEVWEVDLEKVYAWYPGLDFSGSKAKYYSPDKEVRSMEEGIIYYMALDQATGILTVHNYINKSTLPKGVWEVRFVGGRSTQYENIIMHVYFLLK